MRTGQNWGRVKVRARISIRVNAGPGASRVGVSTSTVLKLVLILRDEGDADALVSGLLQNHKPEERHRLLPRCRGGVCRFHGPEPWMDSGDSNFGRLFGGGTQKATNHRGPFHHL